jgi:RNA polymerase sigma factor (sigma-70 family)
VSAVEDLLRELAPQVLGVLVRRYGQFDACEDAVQEALLTAAVHWSRDGVPEQPLGWLIRTASRKLLDSVRSERSRRDREELVHREPPAPDVPDRDDTLILLFLCCHPALSAASAIALTLRAVGGLSTAEIAAAFLVPEATMAQRISRAKKTIRSSDEPFRLPAPDEQEARLRQVLHVLYLIFNEGYAASGGRELHRAELADEAIRLTRLLHGLRPDDAEATGLLALMLLLDARRRARTGPDGEPIPLPEQNRGRWDVSVVAEGLTLLDQAMARGAVGEYQLQAAIAAVHDRAPSASHTDWAQILALYGLLERMTGSPVVTLNRAVAAGMVHGPAAGLAVLDDERLAGLPRLDAVRAYLLELAGDIEAAAAGYAAAAALATNVAERDALTRRRSRLRSPAPPDDPA